MGNIEKGASYNISYTAPEFGAIGLVQARLIIASIVFLPILLRKKYLSLIKFSWKHSLLLAVTNNAIPFTLFSYASFGADSNILAILNATTAFNTMIIAYIWIGENVSAKQLFGLLLGFIGIFILVNPQNSETTLISSMSALLASFFYSYSTVYIQRQSINANKMVLIGWSIIFSAVIMFPVTIFYLPDTIPSISAIGSAIWLGAISTGIGFLGYVRLIDKIGAVKTSTVAYFLPVFGIIWGAVFLDEIISSTIIIGCLIVLIGIYFANSNNRGYVNSVNTKA